MKKALANAAGWTHALHIDRAALLFLLLWTLTMISLPIVRWSLGDAALQRGIVASVLVQATVVVGALVGAWGGWRALGVCLAVVCLAWGAEVLGSATGFPFGAYAYTDALQPQLLGVPLLVPLAWLMMLPPAWAVGALLAGGPAGGPAGKSAGKPAGDAGGGQAAYSLTNRLRWAFASAVAFTAWDLYLDPQMVAWDFWRWEAPGGYFGIPWSNYAGWLLVSFLVSLAAFAGFRPRELPTGMLLAVYVITWLLQAIGQVFFWGLAGPGITGFAGMGAVLALLALRRKGGRPWKSIS